MTKQAFTTLVAGLLFVASGCTDTDPLSSLSSDGPLFQQAPADGNGNKEVIPIDLQFSDFVTCEGGATLSLRVVGWFQVRAGTQPPHQPEVWTYVFDMIYSNAAGAEYVWHQVGSNRWYFDESGNLVVALGGRAGFDWGIVGRLVINWSIGEVVEFVAGKEVFSNDLACDALT